MALKQFHTDEQTGNELDLSKKPYVRVRFQIQRINSDESRTAEGIPAQQGLHDFVGDYESLDQVRAILKDAGLKPGMLDDKNENPVPGGSGPEKPKGQKKAAPPKP